jgi:hypothetical protein
LLVVPLGLAIVKAAVDKVEDEKNTKPLIPTPQPTPKQTFVNILDVKPDIRPEGITPFITVKQRAEQAAFQKRQAKQTREQLLGRFGL